MASISSSRIPPSFLKEKVSSLSKSHPFLPRPQLKAKAEQAWEKLPENAKAKYDKEVPCGTALCFRFDTDCQASTHKLLRKQHYGTKAPCEKRSITEDKEWADMKGSGLELTRMPNPESGAASQQEPTQATSSNMYSGDGINAFDYIRLGNQGKAKPAVPQHTKQVASMRRDSAKGRRLGRTKRTRGVIKTAIIPTNLYPCRSATDQIPPVDFCPTASPVIGLNACSSPCATVGKSALVLDDCLREMALAAMCPRSLALTGDLDCSFDDTLSMCSTDSVSNATNDESVHDYEDRHEIGVCATTHCSNATASPHNSPVTGRSQTRDPCISCSMHTRSKLISTGGERCHCSPSSLAETSGATVSDIAVSSAGDRAIMPLQDGSVNQSTADHCVATDALYSGPTSNVLQSGSPVNSASDSHALLQCQPDLMSLFDSPPATPTGLLRRSLASGLKKPIAAANACVSETPAASTAIFM